jgi:dolichol-phosphate mannosyltransferase
MAGEAGNWMHLLVCVPTYNEAENITLFLCQVFAQSPEGTHILVVDDNSPDGTAALVEKLAAGYPGRLHLLRRPGKQGLAGAYCAAFAWGLEREYDAFLEMDADFSHDPRYIPAMLREIQTHDTVIGSRNIPGGGVEGWGLVRNMVSKGGSLYARLAGLAVNIAVMKAVITIFVLPYKFIAQAWGIAGGMGVNFVMSKLLVWRG